MSEILFVSIGAILGANSRFRIHNKLAKLNLNKYSLILIINTFSSFSLGLFLSVVEQFRAFNYYYQLVLFFSVGFFGSLSTFSSFIYDLFDLCLKLKFFRALKLFFISVSVGIIAFAFGFFLGNQ
ncbi:fluoride efflux transporter FluC [Prochlorococcus marinus]|uniref:Fluoride-specific ion channel FluC n=1 Tax=Prochlorococcus marinus str. PAC1 TaxID=59924 RepID=A0A0A2C6B1_PROMR|nr:CrcB family protein [Prochlorococcus marinus]KGG21906.1 hypothetical protein EV03_0225 [Prochlorococcus marinus str. PAC1]